MLKMKLRYVLFLSFMSVSGFVWAEAGKVLQTSPFCQTVMNAIGATPEETIQKFGKPISREDRQMKSIHSKGVIDQIVILKYPSARIGFLRAGATDHYLLLGVEMAAGSFSPQLQATIPTRQETAIAKLGKSEEEQADPNMLRYFCTPDLAEWIDLFFDPKTGQITSFVFTSQID